MGIFNIFQKLKKAEVTVEHHHPLSNLLEELNNEQKQAVTATEGYVRVIAGAGSGKTKTLAHRFAYIVNEVGINPSNILCVTFTNKAAQEMKSRVRRLVDMGNINDLICTYHGFCVKVLREDIHRLGYPHQFIIVDKEDQKALLKEVFEELDVKSDKSTYKKVLTAINGWKNQICPEYVCPPYICEYVNTYDQKQQHVFASFGESLSTEGNANPINWKCFIKYLEKQKKSFVLDFDDLMLFTLYLFEKFPEVLTKWQNRLDYIMVDETQDNSEIQWRLVGKLQEKSKNLFVVGDPDQCIYEWRGARPERLNIFDESFAPCQTIILNRNYRSTPNILDVANSVISNNIERIHKDLYTTKVSANSVIHFHGKTEQEEGDYIAKVIIKHLEEGCKLSDIAILFRASHISRYIEQSLIKHKLSYVVYGGIRFFERREIKDILSYLRMLDSADDLSFKRVINLPSRKLGKVFLSTLQEIADMDGTSLYNTLKKNIDNPKLNKQGAKDFVNLIENAKLSMQGMSISDIAQLIIKESSLEEIYRTEGDQERLDNISELISSIKLYEDNNVNEEDLSLTTYLQDIALYTNVDNQQDAESIKIMTIHQAKGLEFPIVFVAGMSEGIFPSHRTIRDRKFRGLEEERRLAYVAYTRAENELYLTESEGYHFEMMGYKYPSRFIFEVKDNLLVREGTLTKELENSAREYIKKSTDGLSNMSASENYSAGDEVTHKIFGHGKIISVNESEQTLEVTFNNGTTKHISISKAESVLTMN